MVRTTLVPRCSSNIRGRYEYLHQEGAFCSGQGSSLLYILSWNEAYCDSPTDSIFLLRRSRDCTYRVLRRMHARNTEYAREQLCVLAKLLLIGGTYCRALDGQQALFKSLLRPSFRFLFRADFCGLVFSPVGWAIDSDAPSFLCPSS